MRKYSLLLLVLFAFLLAACNGDNTGEEEVTPPRPTPTTEEESPTQEEGYPAARPTADPASAYPAEASDGWVIRPAGEQCADNLAYPTADSAVSDLEAAGINILAVEETELLVCDACGCPTSAHYRVLLSGEDLPTAISLGWEYEPQ
ncbi:MAG: hypothetical protein WAM60_10390 [Candidatus Promineifilaceae bacterium]